MTGKNMTIGAGTTISGVRDILGLKPIGQQVSLNFKENCRQRFGTFTQLSWDGLAYPF